MNGCVSEDENGDYNVYISTRLSYDMQRDTMKHELDHIIKNDFDSGASILEVEQLA
jgi:hypothetical protein